MLDQGSVRTTFEVVGRFVTPMPPMIPLLYAECDIGLYVDPATGNSLKDTHWVCLMHNSWMTVSQGLRAMQEPGTGGLSNDPQAISYRPEVLDGATSVLSWSNFDATVTSTNNPIQTSGCGIDFTGHPITNCLNVPTSTGANAMYFGQAVRITSTGTPAAD